MSSVVLWIGGSQGVDCEEYGIVGCNNVVWRSILYLIYKTFMDDYQRLYLTHTAFTELALL
jgi:hypothetical protein